MHQSTINCFDKDEAVAVKLALEGQTFMVGGLRYYRECEIVYQVRDYKGRLFQVNPDNLLEQLRFAMTSDRQDRDTTDRKAC